MNWLAALRLLLDVYGALFLGLIAIAATVYGVFPYEALMRIGALVFYTLCAAAFVVWLWLIAPRRTGLPPDREVEQASRRR